MATVRAPWIRRAALFTAVLCLLAAAFEIAARRLFEGSPVELELVNEQNKFAKIDKAGIRILILGNSHGKAGIFARRLSRAAWNAAHTSQDLYYDRMKFEYCLPLMPNLTHVIITLDFCSMGYRTERSDRSQVAAYRRAGFPPEHADSPLEDILSRSYFLNYRSLILRRVILSLSDPREIRLGSGKEHAFADDPPELRLRKGAARARLHEVGQYRMEYEEKMMEHLDAMIRLALQADMQVLLLTLPLTEEYRSSLTPPFRARFRHLLARRLKRHQGNPRVRYLDLIRDPSFSAADFEDQDHLNRAGAAKVSAIVDKLIRSSSKGRAA